MPFGKAANVHDIRPGIRDQHGNTEGPTGPGDGGDGMEARIAKLESDVGHIQNDIGDIKTDIRELRNWIIGGFVLLAGALAISHLYLADKIDDASTKHEVTLKEIRDRLPSAPQLPARKP